MAAKRYPEEILKYPEEWVALTRDYLNLERFAGHGKTPGDCMAAAAQAGYPKDKITLLFVPEDLWRNIRI